MNNLKSKSVAKNRTIRACDEDVKMIEKAWGSLTNFLNHKIQNEVKRLESAKKIKSVK